MGSPVSYANCISFGIFGTVRDRNGNLLGGEKVRIAAGGNAYVATSAGGFINNSTDRNYEVNNSNGLAPGTYAVYAANAAGDAISAAVNVKVMGLEGACGEDGKPTGGTQWWKVELRQN